MLVLVNLLSLHAHLHCEDDPMFEKVPCVSHCLYVHPSNPLNIMILQKSIHFEDSFLLESKQKSEKANPSLITALNILL